MAILTEGLTYIGDATTQCTAEASQVAEAPWSVAEWAVALRFDHPRATVFDTVREILTLAAEVAESQPWSVAEWAVAILQIRVFYKQREKYAYFI